MRISVYIPTDDKTIHNVRKIIEMYNSVDEKPYEIIVNAFGVDNENILTQMKDITNLKIPNVKVYGSKRHSTTAENMNLGMTLCSGDILMYHNSVMFPSLKRCEIIKNIFSTTDIVCLTHPYHNYDVANMVENIKYRTVESQEIYERYFPFKTLFNVWDMTRTYGVEFGVRTADFGSVCVKRDVGIKWKETHQIEHYKGASNGMYYDFLIDTLYTYNKSVIIDIPLTIIG